MPSQQAMDAVAQIRDHIVVEQLRMKPMPVQAARESFDSFADWIPCPPDVEVEPVDANGAKAEWIVAPGAATDRALLYLHGGCFVIGSAASHRETCARISSATGGAVLLVDYRRTPEHPCPAAIEDAVSGFNWLVEKKGIPASRIVIAGESAGGNLTLAAMIKLRDTSRNCLPPACCSPLGWTSNARVKTPISRTRSSEDQIFGTLLVTTSGICLRGIHSPRRCTPIYEGSHRSISTLEVRKCCSTIPIASSRWLERPESTSGSMSGMGFFTRSCCIRCRRVRRLFSV
jgi:hypothetical protein